MKTRVFSMSTKEAYTVSTGPAQRPEGSGTHRTIEIAPPAIERIPVCGSLLGGRIDRSMARMHEPMDAEIKALLEGNKTP